MIVFDLVFGRFYGLGLVLLLVSSIKEAIESVFHIEVRSFYFSNLLGRLFF